MKNDFDLQRDIQDALKWDPILKSASIEVTAHDGLVTLSGVVDSYQNKIRVETVAKSIDGVNVLVEHLTVNLVTHDQVSDEDVAKGVLVSLRSNWVPIDRIVVEVDNGHVTLDGNVTHNFQKEAAKKAVGSVEGVKVFTNKLTIVPETEDELEKKTIEHALLRYAATVDQNIRVRVDKNAITLNGTVQSYYQKEEAEKIAWNAPGVLMVNNELVIE